MRLAAAAVTLVVLLAVPAGSGPAVAAPIQEGADEGLDQLSTQALVDLYKGTKFWSLKAITLLALGKRWHPAGAEMVLLALNDKDRRLHAYAVEALARTEPEALKSALTKDLVDELVTGSMKVNHTVFRERVMKALAVVAPADKKTAGEMGSWWSKAKGSYEPAPWRGSARAGGGKGGASTVAETFVRRAFEMSEVGVEVVFCIDTTGSMQDIINAVRDAMKDIAAVIQGVSPKFRIGVVQYKDYDDWKEGAKVLVPLTNNVGELVNKLSKTPASGGGDAPERVEKGLETALDAAQMGWQKESHKAIVIIGDAPCHDDALAKAVELVKNAKDKPFGKEPERPDVATGDGKAKPKPQTRPFITSCMGAGAASVYTTTVTHFKEIAAAGGGLYGEILTQGGAKNSAEAVTAQILHMCFGKEWEREAKAFVEIFQEFRRTGFIP